jgi:hypothetical protein
MQIFSQPLQRLTSLFNPLTALVWKRSALNDPWNRVWRTLPLRAFGPGSLHDWRWYFEKQSAVRVKTIKDLCRWLRDCASASDQKLFHQEEFWQHPICFEQSRAGDCEDHALWAWRKLVELGYSAEFMVGRKMQSGSLSDSCHACVVFEKGDRRFLLEANAKGKDRMIFPLPESQHRFCPALSVDAKFRTFVYDGFELCRKKKPRQK